MQQANRISLPMMAHLLYRSLVVLVVLVCTSCKPAAIGPDLIRVGGGNPATPYWTGGTSYVTAEQLKEQLSKWNKAHFSEPEPEAGGLIIIPEENASFVSVLRLLEILKESGITAYRIEYQYRENPVTEARFILPVHSAQLRITREQVQPPPPTDPVLSPQERIKEIGEKMGGRHQK